MRNSQQNQCTRIPIDSKKLTQSNLIVAHKSEATVKFKQDNQENMCHQFTQLSNKFSCSASTCIIYDILTKGCEVVKVSPVKVHFWTREKKQ